MAASPAFVALIISFCKFIGFDRLSILVFVIGFRAAGHHLTLSPRDSAPRQGTTAGRREGVAPNRLRGRRGAIVTLYLYRLGIPEVAQASLQRAEHSPYYRQIVTQALLVTVLNREEGTGLEMLNTSRAA